MIKSTNPWRMMAEPPMRKPERTKLLSERGGGENVTAQSRGWQITRSDSKLYRASLPPPQASAEPKPVRTAEGPQRGDTVTCHNVLG